MLSNKFFFYKMLRFQLILYLKIIGYKGRKKFDENYLIHIFKSSLIKGKDNLRYIQLINHIFIQYIYNNIQTLSN